MAPFHRPFPSEAADAVGDADAPLFEEREPPPPTPEFVIRSAFLFLRRNLFRILAIGALVGAVTFAISVLFFNKYAATAMIVVDPRNAKITTEGGVLSNIGPDFNAIEGLALVAKSDGFLGAVVDKLDLAHNAEFAGRAAEGTPARLAAIEKLRRLLTVARRGTSYVIEATATSSSPEESAKIANTAAQMIIDDQGGLRSGASNRAASDIESRLAALRDRATKAEEAAADLKARLKVTDAGQGSTLLERRVYELNQQLVIATAKAADARARLDQMRKAGAGASEDLSSANQSSVLNSLRIQYAGLARQLADQSTVLGARHPQVISLNGQLSAVRRQIDAEIARMMTSARTDYLQAQQQEDTLARQLKEAQTESGDLEPQLVKLGELERQAKAEDAVYDELLSRQKQLAETKNLEPNEIRLASAALVPAAPTPGLIILGGAALALGLLAGIACAFARETLRGTLKTTRQAERILGVPVAGTVPLVSPGPTGAAAISTPINLAPWLADLCGSLTLEQNRNGNRVILVASALRGEGRSTAAANIAACLARSGSQTLLVEADRTPPSNGRPRFGLVDVLKRGSDLQRAFIENEEEGYTLLPFGGRTLGKGASAGGLMVGLNLRAMLRLCNRWYDFVVIDGPPVLEASHAKILAQQATEIVFLVEWDKTSQASVKEALNRLDGDAKLLLLNKIDVTRYRLFDPDQSRSLAAQIEELRRAA
jgi:uncharacterized protein involved in exopolysaccharide biosynthesis/Mrp family chromosome partitioning ATPase